VRGQGGRSRWPCLWTHHGLASLTRFHRAGRVVPRHGSKTVLQQIGASDGVAAFLFQLVDLPLRCGELAAEWGEIFQPGDRHSACPVRSLRCE